MPTHPATMALGAGRPPAGRPPRAGRPRPSPAPGAFAGRTAAGGLCPGTVALGGQDARRSRPRWPGCRQAHRRPHDASLRAAGGLRWAGGPRWTQTGVVAIGRTRVFERRADRFRAGGPSCVGRGWAAREWPGIGGGRRVHASAVFRIKGTHRDCRGWRFAVRQGRHDLVGRSGYPRRLGDQGGQLGPDVEPEPDLGQDLGGVSPYPGVRTRWAGWSGPSRPAGWSSSSSRPAVAGRLGHDRVGLRVLGRLVGTGRSSPVCAGGTLGSDHPGRAGVQVRWGEIRLEVGTAGRVVDKGRDPRTAIPGPTQATDLETRR